MVKKEHDSARPLMTLDSSAWAWETEQNLPYTYCMDIAFLWAACATGVRTWMRSHTDISGCTGPLAIESLYPIFHAIPVEGRKRSNLRGTHPFPVCGGGCLANVADDCADLRPLISRLQSYASKRRFSEQTRASRTRRCKPLCEN